MRFHIVHNIPSPYRLHLFERLGTAIAAAGGSLHVHFMATNHADRPSSWARRPDTLAFPASLSRDVGPTWRGRQLHLNPGLLLELRRARPDVVMVGGPWDSPTTLLASALQVGTLRIAWYEPNTQTPGRVTGAARRLKRALLGRYHLVAVPGSEGERYTREMLGMAMPVVTLPNLVDERAFARVSQHQADELRQELGLGPGERLALLPARLAPEKGIVELLEVLDSSLLRDWQLRIVGDGPLRNEVRAAIARRGLSGRVAVVGSLPYERMPALYRAAELFVLPSLYDPNPLTVVEALHSGLSLLVSQRIGNLPEALRDGENGVSFDPRDPEAMRDAARRAFGAATAELATMGRRSREQARFWNTDEAIGRFLDVVATALARRRA